MTGMVSLVKIGKRVFVTAALGSSAPIFAPDC